MVQVGKSDLALDVRAATNAADEVLGAMLSRELDDVAARARTLDVGPSADHLANHDDALVHREQRLLVGVTATTTTS